MKLVANRKSENPTRLVRISGLEEINMFVT